MTTSDAAADGLDARVVVDRGGFILDAALTAAPGRVVALLGPNGAGKSTFLRCLAGLTPPTAGTIDLAGRRLDDAAARVHVPPERRGVGVVFQDYLLFPHLSALDNVAYGLRCRGRARAAARAEAGEWLDRVGLTAQRTRRPGRLSGGEAQRVALARALATEPDLLLLDEPLAALDAGTRLRLRTDLRVHLTGFGGPAVVVTHDAIEAMVLADHLVVLEGGRVAQTGPPAEIARHPRTDYVARLVGLNLYRGVARAGTAGTVVDLDAGGTLAAAATTGSGGVHVALRPSAVSVHRERPSGSPRNVWAGRVTGIEATGDQVRVAVDGAPPVLADVTPAAVVELGLGAGTPVWVTAKATDLTVYPA